MIRLKDIFRMFLTYQLVSLADEHGSQLPYGHRNKIIDLDGVYKDAEVLNMRIISDVLYIRIKKCRFEIRILSRKKIEKLWTIVNI